MNNLANAARALVMLNLMASDFHNGDTQKDHTTYWEDAETKINAMSNMELLELIGEIAEDEA